jgi:hypothetical protein
LALHKCNHIGSAQCAQIDLTVAETLVKKPPGDPAVRVVSSVVSVDVPGATNDMVNSCATNDKSVVPLTLTQQIPIVTPVRERVVEFGRVGTGDSRDPVTGQCTPDCPETASFPWTVPVNGTQAHSMNANRAQLLVPKPGEVEHWTYVNTGGGWDHPIHLHFEEGITMNRGN